MQANRAGEYQYSGRTRNSINNQPPAKAQAPTTTVPKLPLLTQTTTARTSDIAALHAPARNSNAARTFGTIQPTRGEKRPIGRPRKERYFADCFYANSTNSSKASFIRSFLGFVWAEYGYVYNSEIKRQVKLEWFEGYAEYLIASEFNYQTVLNYCRATIDFLIIRRQIEECATTAEFLKTVMRMALSAADKQPFAKAPLIKFQDLEKLTNDERKFMLYWIFTGLRYDSLLTIGRAAVDRIRGKIGVTITRLKTSGSKNSADNVTRLETGCNCYHEKTRLITKWCPVHAPGELTFPMAPKAIKRIIDKIGAQKHSPRRTLATMLRAMHNADPELFPVKMINKLMTWAETSQQLFKYTPDLDDLAETMLFIPFGGFMNQLGASFQKLGIKGVRTNNMTATPCFWINRNMNSSRCIEMIRGALEAGVVDEKMMHMINTNPDGETALSDAELAEMGFTPEELATLEDSNFEFAPTSADSYLPQSARVARLAKQNAELSRQIQLGHKPRRTANPINTPIAATRTKPNASLRAQAKKHGRGQPAKRGQKILSWREIRKNQDY